MVVAKSEMSQNSESFGLICFLAYNAAEAIRTSTITVRTHRSQQNKVMKIYQPNWKKGKCLEKKPIYIKLYLGFFSISSCWSKNENTSSYMFYLTEKHILSLSHSIKYTPKHYRSM